MIWLQTHAPQLLTEQNLFLALQWLIRLVMLIVVPFRRTPAAAKAWLMLIFFQPLVGLGLYLIFGRAIQPRWLQARRRKWEAMFNAITTRIITLTQQRHLNLKADLPQQITYLQKLFPLPPSGGNAIALIDEYETFNTRLIADINKATHHVHLLFYIFRNDATGRQIAKALIEATSRGVTCRVLIDAIGSWPRTIKHQLRKGGVQVHSALPLTRKGFLTRADLRNHRKIAIIDGLTAYTGSQNICNPDHFSGKSQKELMIRIQGPATLALQAIFVADWFLEFEEVLKSPAYFPPLPAKPAGEIIAQVLPSGPDYPGASIDDLLITLIHNARSRIVITTPYFIPSEPLLHALRSAAKRTIEVHLITSQRTDSTLVLLAQRSYYADLLKAGVHIHIYRRRFLHAKHMTIDTDIALIGSSNIDLRSFELNGEISVITYNEALNKKLNKLESGYIAASNTLTLKQWHSRFLPVKVLENLARLLSPLL